MSSKEIISVDTFPEDESKLTFAEGKKEFLALLGRMRNTHKCRLLRWVGGFTEGEIDDTPPTQVEDTLNQIGDVLRREIEVPGGRLEDESTLAPDDQSDFVETDEFVYPDVVLDAMKYSLQKCNKCDSRDVSDLELVSHSMSNDTLTALFDTLPGYDIILDVGSRTGCVLYAAHLITQAKQIVGIEIDANWCKLQKEIVHQFHFNDRVEVINGDVTSKKGLAQVEKADLIVMNNPFEWFAKDRGDSAYSAIFDRAKSGATILTVPSIESQNLDATKWLKNATPNEGPWKDELADFALYTVL